LFRPWDDAQNIAHGTVLQTNQLPVPSAAVECPCDWPRAVHELFSYDLKMIDFTNKISLQVDLMDGASLQMDIWDTAGQERYRTLAPLYYRNATAAIVVFDITDKDSFDGGRIWVEDFKEHRPEAVIVLVCCASTCFDIKFHSD
jgi:GTPase SAR1 family protein